MTTTSITTPGSASRGTTDNPTAFMSWLERNAEAVGSEHGRRQLVSATLSTGDPGLMPRRLGALAERMIGARGDAPRLKRFFKRSRVPMVLVDDERRCVEANTSARLVVRLTLAELRELRIDDLTAPDRLPTLESAWTRLTENGCMAGRYEIAPQDGAVFQVTYYALANALPGLHLISFVPADWLESELFADYRPLDAEPAPHLTARELEVLGLAAEGCSGPMIARKLVVSLATVRTHFEHIYTKLSVRDRAGAVAKAMRLNLIC
jgi:ATP/maltotriose-dependent transcriptional regulator MalT